MDRIDELARENASFIRSDNSFQRRARTLQSIWRCERRYEMGVHSGSDGEVELGSRLRMPEAQANLHNYLTETIRSVVRCEVLDPQRSRRKLYAKPRIFNDLLSSQPLCFNLFGELQQDLPLATKVFQSLTRGRVGGVTGIEFEHSPGRGEPKYTGDRSAFDVYVEFDMPGGGNGFIGIEVKYHENLAGKAAAHRARYDESAEGMGCFKRESMDLLRKQPLQQIWRDHLLAGALRSADHFDDGFFAFLYPRDNGCCSKAVEQYRNCLSDTNTFEVWTLEQVVDAVMQHPGAEWIRLFVDRYLAFEKLERASGRS